MEETVDAYRYLDFITRKVIRTWVAREEYAEIPWTPLKKPLPECRVAALSSAAARLSDDQPFDREGERQNPWWGDPSFRRIPVTGDASRVAIDHLHIPNRFAAEDLSCVLPLAPLRDMAEHGEIGSLAPAAYSFMGYLLNPEPFLRDAVPAIIRDLKDNQVDLAIFFLV